MTPLLKNVGLAFLAGFITTLAALLPADVASAPVEVIGAAGLAAVYAGARGAIGYLKAKFGEAPFGVDTEA